MSHDDKFENTIFRYRSIDALLGEFQELERQSIYFSPPERLNDPMEGLRQIYWRGDRITWRNLLRHYITCLYDHASENAKAGDQHAQHKKLIRITRNTQKPQTQESRDLCRECIKVIEAQASFVALLDLFEATNREIEFSELLQILSTVHLSWLCAIQEIFQQHGQCLMAHVPSAPQSLNHTLEQIQNLQNLLSYDAGELPGLTSELLSTLHLTIAEETSLLLAYNYTAAHRPKPNNASIVFEFPNQYLHNLTKLIYPPWYVACFSSRNDNAAMWSYYADNHNGCCLVFNTEIKNTTETLKLKEASSVGLEGLFNSQQKLKLIPVQYEKNNLRVEFFKNICRLPPNELKQNWFQDNDGTTSSLAEHLSGDLYKHWLSSHWEKFASSLLCKLPDWEHEQEHRIILPDALSRNSDEEGRAFTYDFSTLKGIVFGIRVTTADKIRIMKIVERKINERSLEQDFAFYQVRYIQGFSKIQVHALHIIKKALNQTVT